MTDGCSDTRPGHRQTIFHRVVLQSAARERAHAFCRQGTHIDDYARKLGFTGTHIAKNFLRLVLVVYSGRIRSDVRLHLHVGRTRSGCKAKSEEVDIDHVGAQRVPATR